MNDSSAAGRPPDPGERRGTDRGEADEKARALPRLDHIGIAVERLADAVPRFEQLLGIACGPIEEVPDEAVRVAFFELHGLRIELLEPTDDSSAIRRFLDRGRSGVHHIALRVDTGSLAERIEELHAGGLRTIGETRASGGARAAFVHPRDACGVLLELFAPADERERETSGDPHEPVEDRKDASEDSAPRAKRRNET